MRYRNRSGVRACVILSEAEGSRVDLQAPRFLGYARNHRETVGTQQARLSKQYK